MISAIDIRKLYYTDTLTEALTATKLKTLLGTATEIKNVHQDTWSIDETEPSQDTYKNQLTGMAYRLSRKTMGDVTFNFTIGQYDYITKAALMGGKAITADGTEATSAEDAKGWQRSRGTVETHKALIAMTYDGVYCVLPKSNVVAREAYTDGAVGMAVVGTMLEPDVKTVAPEYWFDAAEVDGENWKDQLDDVDED